MPNGLCSHCGGTTLLIHRHHDDYAKPDETRNLCSSCHRGWHCHHVALNRPHEVKDIAGELRRFRLDAGLTEMQAAWCFLMPRPRYKRLESGEDQPSDPERIRIERMVNRDKRRIDALLQGGE